MTTPAQTVVPAPGRYAPVGRAWGLLLMGRGAFRGLWLAAPLLMGVTWTPTQLGAAVAAMGSFGWLTLALGSTEKTLLKYVPRMPRLTPWMVRVTLIMVGIPALLSVLVATVLSVSGADASLWLWGLAWGTTGGLLQVVASLHRLSRHHTRDTLLFLGAAAWMLVVSGVSIAVDATAVHWFAGCVAGLITMIAASLIWLPRTWRRVRSRPGGLRPLLASLCLLGLPEVLSLTSVSAGFWAIAALAAPEQAVRYYVAALGAGIFGSLVGYVVRVLQPDVSLRMRGVGIEAGRRRALRLIRRAILIGIGSGLIVVVAWTADAPWWLLLGLLTIGEIGVFTHRTVAANLVENGRREWLPGNVLASAIGLAVAGVILLATVRSGGAVAAMAALLAAQTTNAAVLHGLLARRLPERSAA